jgi:hypothetical protein
MIFCAAYVYNTVYNPVMSENEKNNNAQEKFLNAKHGKQARKRSFLHTILDQTR